MTQASKARKRKPVQVVTLPHGMTPEHVAKVREIIGATWLPVAAKVEYVYPRPRPTLTVLPAKATAGVGGRRHRRRRRAEIRKASRRALFRCPMPAWA